jgi:hypothetical protein
MRFDFSVKGQLTLHKVMRAKGKKIIFFTLLSNEWYQQAKESEALVLA